MVNLVSASGIGSFHYIAANGDSIFAEDVGQAEQTGTPGVVHVVEINTITGGTGRFAGATGSFTLHRLLDVSADPDPFSFGPFSTSGSFHGTITSQGAED